MIYTIGSIAVSGNTLTGTGTNFKAPLSMIREGCTLIAVSDPIQIFTITEIKSETELSVTPAADPAISAGTKFSILLSDSISVDGLAQDVAETLRYYQGKETEIANAVEFFQEFDLDGLIALVDQVHTGSSQVSADKATTQQYKTDAESAKTAAEAAAEAAEEGSVTATEAAVNAAESAANAEKYKNIAEGYKNDINPDSFLRIQNNLSDLADRAAAWLNVRPIGSTPLAGDPVNDYDAVTMRWVKNYINSGTVGPTMNGNTSWSVINVDKSRPSTGVRKTTGVVKSVYKIGDASECEVSMWGDAYIDQSHYAVIEVENKASGNKGRITVNDSGVFESASFRATTGKLLNWGDIPAHGATFVTPFTNVGTNWLFNSNFSAGQESAGGYATWYSLGLIHHNLNSFARTSLHCVGDNDCKYGVRLEIAPFDSNIYFTKWDNHSVTENSTVTKNAISDIRFKHNVQHTTVDKAWSNLENLDFVTFVFNGDEKERVRRGIISQSAELIDPLYVKTRTHYDNNNKEIEVKELDNTPLLLDTMHVTQSLMLKATTLEEENASLRTNAAIMDERITNLENQVSELVALVKQLTGSNE